MHLEPGGKRPRASIVWKSRSEEKSMYTLLKNTVKKAEHESRNGYVVIVIYELMNNNIKSMSKI
jgi:hypothetical protein